MLRTGLYIDRIRAWRNGFGVKNVLVLIHAESDLTKIKKISALMGDYLPSQKYPWETIENKALDLSSTELEYPCDTTEKIAFDASSSTNTDGQGCSPSRFIPVEHQKASEWLRGYFHIDATWL